jgi:putative endonuclease
MLCLNGIRGFRDRGFAGKIGHGDMGKRRKMQWSRGELRKHFFVYMVASKPRGILYIGVTSDLATRAWEHREGVIQGFTKRYFVRRLVWFEEQPDALSAIKREKQLKRWRRTWKIALVEKTNPNWRDLYEYVAC